MKILFLAPADNYHTKKWCEYFVSKGDDVSVISFFPGEINDVNVYHIDCGMDASKSDFRKLAYLFQGKKINRIVKEIKPDIISVHYASSYGAAAAFAGIKHHYLSVWGADVYEIPEKSILHKILIMKSLHSAGYIMSTSRAMAEQTRKYTDKKIYVTPFGVKTDLFSPDKRRKSDDSVFTIGTVKALEDKYGINFLLEAVALVHKKTPNIKLQLRISGKGSKEEEYKALSRQLDIENITTWVGFIPQEKVAEEWANMDLAVIPSVDDSESFGVSAIEAQACETAVIISDIPGLMEATKPGETSIVVERRNSEMLANEILHLYNDRELRLKLGKNGRRYVRDNYEYESCFSSIRNIFLSNVQN